MKTRRLLAALTAAAMSATLLTGCGGDKPAANGSGSGSGSGAKSGDGYNITMICGNRDEFGSALEQGSLAVAKEMNVKLTTQDAQNDVSRQIQFVESAHNAGEDAILVQIVDPGIAKQCIEAANGTPLVFYNRALNAEDMDALNEIVAYVGSDENTSGYFQGEYLAKYFNEKGQKDVKYLMLSGTLGAVYTTMRTEGVLKGMKDGGLNPIEAAAPLVADYERATAMDMISPLVDTAEYDCIIANNDAMALGAVEALKSKGLDPTKVPIVGIDATVDGREAIKSGEMAMTVFQNPDGQGRASLMAAINMIEGKPINEGTQYEVDDEYAQVVWVPFEPVTIDNVADYE
ncbi:MAG: sugar ABC transporter substrate-binding protein [Butyricicoccus pullicaecorum]|nr:sugar ABC transporter substrate-binding protein [Butyricicoccus pullicaecorum]